ncbi:hypothetical protein [Pseudorhodoferax sp. Leaf267]|uniref:hypothetical protein n=1 Tax=Pseudorhodoferax sp. Leaf267 TaxID=1736316 RepID=UPI00070216DC|nr:hypothetical protein [Pseudorhodoferax sp. Leaf267]KQP20049.1 hypothetical protein ASF43_28230 [Pseudorhodoferax sp. Leaf267]
MADAATPNLDSPQAFQTQVAQILAITARAWRLTPRSAQALARRAAYGYVPRRTRLRTAAALALRPAGPSFAYSW